MANTRLDKLLSDSGLYSRSEARTLIRAGRVQVDGVAVRQPEAKYDPAVSAITVDGSRIRCEKTRCLMLYKPAGVLSATEDARQKTVLDLLPPEYQKLGLLLLPNDGDLAHRVITPKKHVPKVYRAQVDGALDNGDVAAFAGGIVLADGIQCLPAKLEALAPNVGLVTVFEGKYHQVKRMFAARGKPVVALHRLSIGGLALDETLRPGEYRELRPEELAAVFNEA